MCPSSWAVISGISLLVTVLQQWFSAVRAAPHAGLDVAVMLGWEDLCSAGITRLTWGQVNLWNRQTLFSWFWSRAILYSLTKLNLITLLLTVAGLVWLWAASLPALRRVTGVWLMPRPSSDSALLAWAGLRQAGFLLRSLEYAPWAAVNWDVTSPRF